MFTPLSRFSAGLDVVITLPRRRTLALKSLPMMTHVRDAFRHTVADDTLPDHLTCTSYDQPCIRCRISDVNPACLSLRAFGNDPIVTDRFPITFAEAQPSWDAVVQELTRRVGVESAQVEEAARIVPETQTPNGKTIPAYVEKPTWTMVVTYNRMHLSPGDVACMIASHGLCVGEPQSIGRVSRNIVIPPL